LVENGFPIKAVVTVPDKPAGRGCKISESEVKKYAIEAGLKVLQPEKLKNSDFIDELKQLNADLFIVVAFRMLPAEVWKMPKLGTFNLHASLLPDYRGAAPINHAIINGETKTGITTFFINEDIDTGSIILQEECIIEPEDNIGSLHDKLMIAGAELVLKTVELIRNDEVKTIDQSKLISKPLNPALKLSKEFCKIDFNLTGLKIHNLIRGLSPYPAAWFALPNFPETVKVYKSIFEPANHTLVPGQILSDNKSFIKIAVLDGYLSILDLQMSGKKRMSVKDFLNGFRVGSSEL
jgi:methionyl-tRNA formyltransferase